MGIRFWWHSLVLGRFSLCLGTNKKESQFGSLLFQIEAGSAGLLLNQTMLGLVVLQVRGCTGLRQACFLLGPGQDILAGRYRAHLVAFIEDGPGHAGLGCRSCGRDHFSGGFRSSGGVLGGVLSHDCISLSVCVCKK